MKKSMLILLICTAFTACGNYETGTAVTENVATETAIQLQTEAVTQAITEIAAPKVIEKIIPTSEPIITTTLSETTSTTSTTTETFITEKKNEIKARVTTAEVKYAEAVKTTTTTEMSEKVTTTLPPETTTVTATTEVTQTELPQNNLTDYERALAVYEYMTVNGSGTCVQYAYQTYEMCREYGLECYFAWTENRLYGHVANVVNIDGIPDSADSSEDEKIKTNTFIAEFFDSGISFADTSKLVTEVMKGCTFESETDSSNGIQKISLKGKNGGGVLNVMCIDLSKSNLSYDMEYILENFGDYYFRQTASQMNGITEDDFVSNYRMTSSVVSKGKYQHYSSVQKTDGMASQFGYTETYAVLNENKLTVVSGAYLSTDMMERQSFMQLMVKFAENVKY